MKYRSDSDGLILVSLEKGDDLVACVEQVAKECSWVGASVSAIGAVKDPKLAYYNLPTYKYQEQVFPGDWELVSLLGNISLRDEKPFLHAHVSISDSDFTVRGGHLVNTKVAVVVEMLIKPMSQPLYRSYCEDIKLFRWEPHFRPET